MKSFSLEAKLLGIFSAGTAFLLLTIAYSLFQGQRALEAERLRDHSSLRLRTLDLALSTLR